MHKFQKFIVLSCIVVSVIVFPDNCKSQSLSGVTGLITIPTARMQKDGTLSFGISYFDRKHQVYFDGTKDVGHAYINLTILPFLELVFRANRPLNYQTVHEYTVDRTPMVRVRLFNETKYFPSIVVGIHDFASTSSWGTVYFNATYFVMSKKVQDFDFHMGYAPRIMKAQAYQLDGLFGGLAYTPHKAVSIFAEYDSKTVNSGVEFHFLKHFGISLATINFDSYAAGMNYKVFL
ncbi:MAG: YjbH domain-containing protein [Prolixibacteraceae bacterium]|nr:YjbH domain-containing protein [Prolixibacteraceae bacterium]